MSDTPLEVMDLDLITSLIKLNLAIAFK